MATAGLFWVPALFLMGHVWFKCNRVFSKPGMVSGIAMSCLALSRLFKKKAIIIILFYFYFSY